MKKGQTWKASAAAVAELTDMEKVEEGEITVEFVGVTEVERQAGGAARSVGHRPRA